MTSEFLLVEWCGEGKYSVVFRDKIVNVADQRKVDVDLIGQNIEVYWGRSRKKPYLATILQCGIRDDLEFELQQILADMVAQSAVLNTRVQQPNHVNLAAVQIENVLEQIPIVEADNSAQNWKALYEESAARAVKYKNKVKTLKRKLKEYEGADETVQLSPTVLVNRAQLDTIKTVSSSPSSFARNLMRCIFKNEELVGRSLFGRACNANRALDVKPSIDPIKRDAVILQTLAQFGGYGQGNNNVVILKSRKNPLLSQIHTSLGDMLREVTKKAASQMQT